ncbi:hypothetical protein AB0L25_38645 [Spirillospora sp. NPDC052242]
MESDEPGRRPGGPRRAPMSRPARRQPPPRRTSGRTGAAPRRPRPPNGPARGGRPGPAPRPVPYPEPGYGDQGYADPGYADQGYADQGYADPGYVDQGYAGHGHDAGYPDPGGYQEAPYAQEPPAAAPRRGGRPAGGRPGTGAGKTGQGKSRGKGAAKNARNAKNGKGVKAPKSAQGPNARKGGKGRPAGGPVPKPGPGGLASRAGQSVAQGLAALGPKAYFAAAGALAAVVLLGFGALAVASGADGDDARGAALPPVGNAAETGLSPTSYSSSPSSDAYAGIAARQADAKPLTLDEAFPKDARSLTVPGSEIELELAEKKLDGDCAAAVWGASVAADLRRGGCTQAVRGLYADTDGGYGMAVAVFNLASAADADRFVATLGEVRGGGFVRPLPVEGPAAEFGAGFGMARGLAQGHFAVVSWAARLDGKGDAADEALLSMLIEGGKAPAVLARAAGASG